MAIIKNKYKDRTDSKIKDFPNGTIPSDFTKKIIYDNETLINPTIVRTPKYGDDLDTTEFSKVVADLVYNDTIINEESEKHNYLYSNGIIRNYKKEFEIYDKNLFQVLSTYEVNSFLDDSEFSLKVGNSIAGNFSGNIYCKLYFYTNSQRLKNLYSFFYREFNIIDIITQNNNTPTNFNDDYSIIKINGEINITNQNIQAGEFVGVVLYLPITTRNTTPFKPKNFIDYVKVGNGSLKIGDTFVDVKKDTYISRSVTSDTNFNQIKISNIIETNFLNTFRTRRDVLLAYYDQIEIQNNIIFDGIIDLIAGDERIGTYAPVDTQLLATPRIKKIEYLTVGNESFHRIHLDDLCMLKGRNQNGTEILFRKINQAFTIRNSINNIFDGEYTIKNINYENRTIDFVHPTFNGQFYQPQETENIIGYYGYLVPNIYVIYSILVYKDDGYSSETQIMQVDPVFEYIGLESGVTRIEKTALEINTGGMFEVSNNSLRHLRNFNGNLLEYDDGQSSDVPSKFATGFTLDEKNDGDYILRPAEQQLPNEYDEIGLNSLANSHFIITEDNFSIINNSKISLSEVYLGIKNSLSSIGTEGIKIKIEALNMLYALDDPRRIENIAEIPGGELKITLLRPDSNIRPNDILFIMNNSYIVGQQKFYGNGDYQTVKIKRIENDNLIIDIIPSTFTAYFKYETNYPIYFNIIKHDEITKVCESLLTNNEIRNQIINGLNGKFGDKNSYSKLKFDRFIENINPNNDLLTNGITLSQAKDFKLEINKYYYISVSGFVVNNIATSYSSILIEDHNAVDQLHFKKGIYREITIKSFKGRYPNSIIISDDFGDINVFNITRTFAPFFRVAKYSIVAHDFSNLNVSLQDVPSREDVVLVDALSGRFKFHPNVTPSKIYLSYYNTEKLSGAAEAENFVFKRGNDSNDTIKGKIQDLDNKYVYGADFKSPITVNGIIFNETLNYKGPFRIKNNKIELKTNNNFVDLDTNKFDVEIDKNSVYEIIDIEKNSVYLKTNVIEKNNELQSINRQFIDQLRDQKEKDYYEKPTLNHNEEMIFNISEDTTINQSLISTKKWQRQFKVDNNITIPFLTNKKFNKISFHNFDKKIIVDCFERTKIENLILNQSTLNEILEDFVYRKLNEKNYRYALNQDYSEDTTFSFRENDEIKQLNKKLVKDSVYFNKSEMANVFIENENNAMIKRTVYDFNNLNINNSNSDVFIIINEHIVNFDLIKINKKYTNNVIYSNSILNYNSPLPSSNAILEGTLYFYQTAGYNEIFELDIEIGDFIIKNSNDNDDITDWDFYKKNSFFNISKMTKADDLTYSLNDFNDIGIDYKITNFANSLQSLMPNTILVKHDLLKITEKSFLISVMLKDSNDVYSLYIQFFESDDNNFFYPKIIDNGKTYKKIATSQTIDDYIRINKNNLYYNFMAIDENTIVFCIMSDSFLFKYFYLNDLTIDEGVNFINDKEIKNNPRLFKLNDEVFCVVYNCENILNYDSSIGDLEIKLYDIKTKNNIIFSYRENSLDYSNVDKILIDNIKNSSNFNYLKITDDNLIVFYSNINAFYLNNLSFINNEYVIDSPSGLLNCFKIINFIKTDTAYELETSNKKTVFYQNIGQTAFPPKIYPFKIDSNIFGVNYIQYNLNNAEIGNRLYTFDIDGVLQKEIFKNDEYTNQNPNNIKYIYSFNNRQAIEFSVGKISIHNFNNDYTQLIMNQNIDYRKYFPNYNYNTIFGNRLSNPIEIKTISDINGNVFDKKIFFFFTKINNNYKINIGLIKGINIDFSTVSVHEIDFQNGDPVELNDGLVYQNDIIHYGNKIYLIFTFLIHYGEDGEFQEDRLAITMVEIGQKIIDENNSFTVINNIKTINHIKINETKKTFFFNKITNSKIEIYCLREISIDEVDKNIVSKFTFEITGNNVFQFLEMRIDLQGDFNLNDDSVDIFFNVSDLDITNIYKVNFNNKIKYILETLTVVNNQNSYNYFYIENNLQIFSLFSLTEKLNIKYSYYDVETNELLTIGDIGNTITSYVFNFNTNLYTGKQIDTYTEDLYEVIKLSDTDKNCFVLYRINGSNLLLKMLVKKEDQNLLLAYQNNYQYTENIESIIFNGYENIYETFIYSVTKLIRDIWYILPMNNVAKSINYLEHEIIENKLQNGQSTKDLFSNNSISGVVGFDENINNNIYKPTTMFCEILAFSYMIH